TTDIALSTRSTDTARRPERARTTATAPPMSSDATAATIAALATAGTGTATPGPATAAAHTTPISTSAASHRREARASRRVPRRAATAVCATAGTRWGTVATAASATR